MAPKRQVELFIDAGGRQMFGQFSGTAAQLAHFAIRFPLAFTRQTVCFPDLRGGRLNVFFQLPEFPIDFLESLPIILELPVCFLESFRRFPEHSPQHPRNSEGTILHITHRQTPTGLYMKYPGDFIPWINVLRAAYFTASLRVKALNYTAPVQSF
jgi:hypothetical protein